MGLQPCQCSASVNSAGTTTIRLGFFNITVAYELGIEICPNCQFADSTVSASLSADLPNLPIPGLPDTVSATFEGAPIGLPVCTEDTLTVEVAGTLDFNGNESEVSVTLSLNETTGEVCLVFEEALPVIGNRICIDVGDIDIEPCNG